MKQARLYDSPQEFAEMMMQHLRDSLKLQIEQRKEEPLLLEVIFDKSKGEVAVVSLHSTMDTYMASGDINTAIDYLNNVIACAKGMQSVDEVVKLDPRYIYPVVRDLRYIEEASIGSAMLSEPYLPGLGVIFLETKNSYSKIINTEILAKNPQLTEERVKQLAYRNLIKEGWSTPSMRLPVPLNKACHVDVFMDKYYPSACQFLHPQLSRNRLPESCVIAFSNRKTTLLLRSDESMDTMAEAAALVKKSRFKEVVERSFRVMPHPVSNRMFWFHKGEAKQLEMK